eukprot:XP_015573284.1 cullin-1 isoform X2 [Ricinus communis]
MKLLKFYYIARDTKRFKEFEAGLKVIQDAVDKVNSIVEGTCTPSCSSCLSSEDYMLYYTVIYNLSVANPLGDYSKELYYKYKEIFEDHITSKVLPSLREKRDQDLLQELVNRWADYKIMTRWLSRFFHFLDRYFIPTKKLPSLQETSFTAFHNSVYGEMNSQIRDAVISMINGEREGEEVDHALVNNIVSIYVEMGIDSNKYYDQDFEAALLQDTATFYSEKASNWIQFKSYNDYLLMAEQCLKHEKEKVSFYLQATTQKKLLQVVEHELLNVHASELEEMKQLDHVVVVSL